MPRLLQLTPPGKVFAYYNAALNLAGHLIATVTGSVYEDALQDLLLDPLGLTHTGFFTDELVGYNLVPPTSWRVSRR